jgi:hypothetical protein
LRAAARPVIIVFDFFIILGHGIAPGDKYPDTKNVPAVTLRSYP